ncbi:hypothetical protein JVU11DRAFT_7259 [Chiua virens]|nr:hypothetical protein JVU11DRAFT_7259 [Chiua virens]
MATTQTTTTQADLSSSFAKAVWTQTSAIPGQRSWRRSLGITESVYYWEGACNGAADTVMHVHLRVTQLEDVGIYAPENVRRAWLSVKRRFPLIAAEVSEENDGLHFVVRERNITSLREEEVTFGTVLSFNDAERFVDENRNSPRPLSPRLLTRVYVLNQTDRPEDFHVVLPIVHCITDGCSTTTILRSFFQTLSTPFDPHPTSIEERLQMCCPLENWVFPDDVPLVKRRWKRAIGYALHVARRARLAGGHGLPGNFTRATATTPAKSRTQLISFPPDISAIILSNCRRHNITFNSAYHVFSQVAISRLLCRRYLRGEISEGEWEYRKRQPMLFIGLVNLRSHFDPDWFCNGGSGEIGLNFSFHQHVLPFMPLGAMANKKDELELINGAPRFQDLMSFGRFLLRCEWVKSRGEKLFRNPRFLEICIATHNSALETNKSKAANWRRSGERARSSAEALEPLPLENLGPVFTQRGSSLGNMDCMMPLDYPLPANHHLSPISSFPHPHRAGYPVCTVPDDVVTQCERPRLHVEYWQTHFRSRPGDVYLGALTTQKQLQYFTFYDENAFSEDLMKEFMGELKNATLWYLGQRQETARDVKCKL